jgi:SAM-dependent methyltransferase
MQEHTDRRSCPVCGASNALQGQHGYSPAPWILLECAACSMVWLENPPAASALEDELAWEKTFATEAHARRKRNPVLYKLGRLPKAAVQSLLKRDKLLDLVKRYVEPGPILDVGCAGGHTLAAFPPSYIPHGVEISRELSRVAQQIFAARGGFVVQGDAPTAMRQFTPRYFTGVVMGSYLEHEPRAHEVLLAARAVMRDRARLVIKVPNYASWNRTLRGSRWCGFRFPDHVNYFAPRTLVRLLEETGFNIVRFQLTDRMPTADTMWLVAEAAGVRAEAA